jgi:nucleotide-binding universal stress UspA family protein
MQQERDRIVVGVDASPGARAAARWALMEGVRRHADVDVVACWHVPYLTEAGGYGLITVTPEDLMAGVRDDAQRCLGALEVECTSAREAGTAVHLRMVEGDAAESLVIESKGALMVVVGRHGRGAVGRVLLGSVGNFVVAHATCPVVVVPADAAAA